MGSEVAVRGAGAPCPQSCCSAADGSWRDRVSLSHVWSPGGKSFVLVTSLWGQHTPLLRASLPKARPGCAGTLHPVGRRSAVSRCCFLGATGHVVLWEVSAGPGKRPLVQGEVVEERVSSTVPWPKLFLSIWDLQPPSTTYSRLTGHGFIFGTIWTDLPPKAAYVTRGSAHTGEPPGPAGPGVRPGLARLCFLGVSRSLQFQQGGSFGDLLMPMFGVCK